MNTENLPFILFLLLTGVMAHAAPPQTALTVAVYDFKGDGDAASYGNNVTTLVTADLTTETNLGFGRTRRVDEGFERTGFWRFGYG